MPVVRTLADFQKLGHAIWAYCQNIDCRHRAELDLTALIERLGPDYAIPLNPARRTLVCTRCGGRGSDVSISIVSPWR